MTFLYFQNYPNSLRQRAFQILRYTFKPPVQGRRSHPVLTLLLLVLKLLRLKKYFPSLSLMPSSRIKASRLPTRAAQSAAERCLPSTPYSRRIAKVSRIRARCNPSANSFSEKETPDSLQNEMPITAIP